MWKGLDYDIPPTNGFSIHNGITGDVMEEVAWDV